MARKKGERGGLGDRPRHGYSIPSVLEFGGGTLMMHIELQPISLAQELPSDRLASPGLPSLQLKRPYHHA
ncbi:hypothetical protein RDI58_009579 [Solanum bulbocastanum]|uniref:Uncharacterized protein n=1 Tax=Solanum bulbocastanum TaxID=147425 RepID=A0AAN8YIL0_SOLBU